MGSLGRILDRIQFLEDRVLHESIRANSQKAPACNVKANASTNHSLIEDEIARLKGRDVPERRLFEEILGITQLVVLQDILYTLPNAIPPRESRKPRTLILFT